jgi:hypothetical protein
MGGSNLLAMRHDHFTQRSLLSTSRPKASFSDLQLLGTTCVFF